LPLNTLVGYFVIKLPVNIGLKYLLIVLVTNILAFAVYEIIKPIGLLRFLLGMKVRAGNNKIMG
jgi:hypothetical protein